jgi:hypothetical protein
MAGRVALAHALILDRAHLPGSGETQVAARQPAEGPANRVFRPAQVKQVLLGFVGDPPGPPFGGERGRAAGFQHEKPLERVEPRAGATPLLVGVPFELGAHCFGHPSAMHVTETAEDASRHPDTEGVDQLFPEQPLGHRVENQRPLACKADEPSSWVELEKFLEIEVFDAHESPQGEEHTLSF